MIIDRNEYVEQLLAKRWNGRVKIVTGIRRSGKSFLLSTLFKRRLVEEGVREEEFVEVALDRKSDIKYRNPNLLYDYIMSVTKDVSRRFYVFIDEIYPIGVECGLSGKEGAGDFLFKKYRGFLSQDCRAGWKPEALDGRGWRDVCRRDSIFVG